MIRTQLNGPNRGGGFLNNIGCLLMGFAVLFFGFYILKYVMIGLFVLSPIFFIAAYFINPKAVGNIVAQHIGLAKYDFTKFLGRTVIILLLFPFVSLGLIFIASGLNKAKQFQGTMFDQMQNMMNQQQGKGGFAEQKNQGLNVDEEGFVEYEEIESEPLDDTDTEKS